MRRPQILWTDAQVAELRALWDEGLTGSEIGKRLGCSKAAAIGKAWRLKLKPRLSPLPAKQAAPKVRMPVPNDIVEQVMANLRGRR